MIYHRPFSHFRVNHTALIAGNLGADHVVYSEPETKAALDGIQQVLQYPDESSNVPVTVTRSLKDAVRITRANEVILLDPKAESHEIPKDAALVTAPIERMDDIDPDDFDDVVGVGAPVGELAALAVVLYDLVERG